MLQEHTIHHHDISIHAQSLGKGPLVIFCHGFPGHWSHWLAQMHALANEGFTAVALDMRGYGKSSRPHSIDSYNIQHQIDDLIAVLKYFRSKQAVFIGQDFGAALVWNMALRHPEYVAGVIAISVPFDFDYYGRSCLGHLSDDALALEETNHLLVASPLQPPTVGFKIIANHQFFHAHYFQQPGLADKELGENTRLFLTRLYWALSDQGSLGDWSAYTDKETQYLDVLPAAPDLPWPWMSIENMDQIEQDYLRKPAQEAFTGALASYRVADINWCMGEAYKADNISVPTLLIAGKSDPVIEAMNHQKWERMQTRLKDCRGILLVEGAGHFVQLEKADICSKHMIEFLNKLLNFNEPCRMPAK